MKRIFIFVCCFMLAVVEFAMATPETLVGTKGVAGYPVYGRGQAGGMKVAYGTYEIAAAVEDGDIFQLCRIPAGATVIGGWFYADDMDVTTGTEALDMDIGWASNGVDAADADGLLNAGTLAPAAVSGIKPETGISMPLGGVLITSGYKTFSEETVIQAEVNTAAASFTAGTIGVIIKYTMD